MRTTTLALYAALGASLLGGCARHVVVEPEQVHTLNDDRWTVHSEPGSQAPTRHEHEDE